MTVVTNSQLAIEAARAEWEVWQQAFDDRPIELFFHVTTEASYYGRPRAFFADARRFVINPDSRNLAIGEPSQRSASAFLEERAVEDRPYFVYHFLDAMAFQLITSLNFTPMHGATVSRNGRGVLFTGDSAQGKSSLSYACARRGWTFVSDDASHLLRRAACERRIIGAPHHVRLRPDAPKLFPELAKFEPAMRGNGKLSLQIPTRAMTIETTPDALIDTIVMPRRATSGGARLEPIGKDVVREYCSQWFYHWDPPVLKAQQQAFEEMLQGVRTFSLEYSDLDAAVDTLDAANPTP